MELPQTIKQEKTDYFATEPGVNFETNIVNSMELKMDCIKIEPAQLYVPEPEAKHLDQEINLMEGAKTIGDTDKFMFHCSQLIKRMPEENTDRKFYSEREKMILLSLIEQYKTVVENKKTDGASIRQKQEVWEKIAKVYNSHDVTKRNVKQLKKLWDNIKQRTRKYDFERKNYILKTGGEPPPEEDNNPICERVRSIVPTINYEEKHDFYSIAILNNKNFQEVKTIDNNKVGEKHDLPDHTNINRDFGEENSSVFEIPEIEDHTYEINRVASAREKTVEQGTEDFSPIKRKRKIKTKKISKNSNLSLHEEAALRRKKLEDSIEQQKELHLAKMEAVALEKKYWQKKIELL